MSARTLLLATTTLAVCLSARSSLLHAAGYALLEQSAESQGTSHAGSAARADDPSTLFYNPAGMARLPGYQITISGSYISPQSTLYSGAASTNTPFGPVPVSGTLGRDVGVDAVLPALYATAQIAPDWHVGLSVTSPFGLVTKDDTSSIARYYGLTSKLTTFDIAPAVSWQALPNLALGGSLIVETADTRLSNAVDFGTIGAGLGLARFGLLPGRADGVGTAKGSDTAVGYQLGALFEPVPGTRIGLDYRSTIYHDVTGTIAFTGVPAPLAPGFTTQSAQAKLITPANISLGVAQDIGPVTLLAGVTGTQWSRFRQLLVTYTGGASLTDERWRDTVTVSGGADWHINDRFTLRAGAAWDQTPVPDRYRTPRIPDGDRTWLSAGATWKATDHLALSVAYTHIFIDDTKVALIDAGPGTPNFLRGNLAASFSNQVNIVAAQARYAF